ncbi:MAG TPA: GDYXXLXY domain-containing protein [Vicinamibacterales bacterium]|nr:GDYXXLXY domain-containing protein [Vicinamibacterales bacterium]
MPSRKTRSSIAAGVFCLGVLGVMLVGHAWPLWSGETVYLRVVPVDPRDLFRGDYVVLRYAANSLVRQTSGQTPDANTPSETVVAFEGDWPRARSYRTSRMVYVTLEPRPGADGVPVEHVAVKISTRKPSSGTFLRGRAVWHAWTPPSAADRDTTPQRVTVEYGIDAFYVEQGRGRQIERDIRAGKPVFAEVAVASSGRARLRTLIIGEGRR